MHRHISCSPRQKAIDLQFRRICSRVFYSFSNAIETEEEQEYLQRSFVIYIDKNKVKEGNGKVSRALVDATHDFYTQVFQYKLPRLSNIYYFCIPGGFVGATSFVESENKAVCYDPCGPRPCTPLDQSIAAILGHVVKRYLQKKERALARLNTISNTYASLASQPDHPDYWKFEVESALLAQASKMILDQYSLSNNYSVTYSVATGIYEVTYIVNSGDHESQQASTTSTVVSSFHVFELW
jgi:hypothetical protein